MKKFIASSLLAIFIMFAACGALAASEDIIVAKDEFAGCTPYALTVVAYDPYHQYDVPTSYNAVPEEIDPGMVNENTSNLTRAIEAFDELTLTPLGQNDAPNTDLWRFAIEYTVLDAQSNPKTIRLDFYDYTKAISVTRLYLPGEAGEMQYYTMPYKYITVFEEIYIDRVARLKGYDVLIADE